MLHHFRNVVWLLLFYFIFFCFHLDSYRSPINAYQLLIVSFFTFFLPLNKCHCSSCFVFALVMLIHSAKQCVCVCVLFVFWLVALSLLLLLFACVLLRFGLLVFFFVLLKVSLG